MSINTKDVFVGAPNQAVTGAIARGPETDVIPDSIDDFDFSGLSDGGYVTEDGVVITPTESSTSIKDWSLANVRRLITEFASTLGWSHLSVDRVSAENYFGAANVDVQAADSSNGTRMKLGLSGAERERYAWYFRIKDGKRRIVIFVPHGQVGERGEIPFNASGAVIFPVTLDTFPDSAGMNLYIYTDDGVVAAPDPALGTVWSSEVTGSPTGGDYVLTVGGVDSTAIAYNAANNTIQSALNGISGVSGATVTGTTVKTITFTAPVLLTADGAGLSGGTDPDVVVTKIS